MAGTCIEEHAPMHAHTQDKVNNIKQVYSDNWPLQVCVCHHGCWSVSYLYADSLLLPAHLHLCASTAACDKHRVMSTVLISQWWGDNEI